MKKALFLVLLLYSITCQAQFFIGNPDYVYAVGKAKTQTEAENAALLSLANTIGIKVTNQSSYTVIESNGNVSENYIKDIGTNSSAAFGDEVQTYVETDKKSITVYKYVNKKEYVAKQTKMYKDCMVKADSIYRFCYSIKHSKNLILGQYYTAYTALDTPLMDAYGDKNAEIKKRVLDKAKEIYGMTGRLGYASVMTNKGSNGYYVDMQGERTNSVYGFEYLYNGNWVMPQFYYYSKAVSNLDGTDNAFAEKKTPRCLVYSDTKNIYIRYLYEYQKDNALYKIEVPESWYFKKIKIDVD